MTARTLNVALLGYGFAGKTFHAPLIASVQDLKLHVVSSSQPEKVHADFPDAVVEPDPLQALSREDVDLVVIATPNTTHFDLAKAALMAGKHVVVDKPFTLTAVEARELDTLAARSELLLSVFHNRRWDADFLTIKRLIAEGRLGRVVHFESHFDRFRPGVVNRWREQDLPGSGLWYDLGPHVLDQALQLFGMPDTLQADLSVQRDGGQATDFFHVVLGYGPLRVILHGSMLVAAPNPRFIVHGTEGSYIKYGLDPQESALKAGGRPGSENWGHDPEKGTLYTQSEGQTIKTEVDNQVGSYQSYYTGIAAALLNGTSNPVTAEEATLVMELLELGEKSSATGQRLSVERKG
ncbi:oxidoreductase [Deinococcus cellulosilyticus]|uniref:Oxidoreductase n=1 Tax=Deinococcus cellulosilyticus (strain DSM 18568 / NBRC 106333 / KACC 11606 / 5516J-15) TaxID=1223518 RepID=A0A511N7Q7_DEIC1|nr:oxidoreductase [Deinococcus cellulosilyticus]GEM48864.1 oxidoreductase [Deinococcus cellulosilyticus NBRC 106333 = KACC 11606]